MTEEKIKSEDYIHLPPLKKIIVQILQFFFSIVHFLVDAFIKSRILLAAGLITGLILGYAYNSKQPAYYQVSMIAESSGIYKRTVAEMINSMNVLIQTGSYQKLANDLALPESESRQLGFIAAKTLDDEPLESDTSTKYHQPFRIEANIRETELAGKFQQAIVNYINNKPTLKKIKEEDTRFNREKLAFIDRELAKLDTFKTEYNRFLASSKISATFYNNAFDPATIYKQSGILMDEKEEVLTRLVKDLQPILVIDEFKGPRQPQSASLFKSLLISSLIVVGVCYLLGLFIELNKRIKHYTV